MPGTCSPPRARPARRPPRRAPRRRPLGRAPRRPRPCPAPPPPPPPPRWRPRRRPRRCRPRRPPPRRRRLLPPPCRPPPRPRRRRAAPRPRSPRASHPAPPAPRMPTAARRAAARRARGRSAGRALVRRVAPSGGRSLPASADHWRVARRSGMRRPMAEAVGARGRGLMEREVVRVITPGTILEEESLEPGAPSLLAALAAEGDRFGIAAIDFATGAFRATEVRGWELARDELERLAPRELLLAS